MPRCPVCSRDVLVQPGGPLPFCSDRCRLVDLGRWLDESYAVPAAPADDDEEDEGPGIADPEDT